MSSNFNFTSDAELVNDFVEGSKPLPRAQATIEHVAPLKTLKALSYDFDIISVTPDAAQQAHIDALAQLGQDVDDIVVEARWRDPATATAMSQASRGVRELFKAAGFGYTASGKRIPAGQYAVEDAEARHAVVMRLTNTLSEADGSKFDWGQIDMSAFFKAHAEATSIRTQPIPEPVPAPSFDKRKVALIGLVAGLALIIVAGLSAL